MLTIFFYMFPATKNIALVFGFIICYCIVVKPLSIIKRLIYLNRTHFTYGKIKKVEIGQYISLDCEIEFTDKYTNKIYTIRKNRYYGENQDFDENEIQEIYQQGEQLVGNKIPLLYKKKKAIVFFKEKNNKYIFL